MDRKHSIVHSRLLQGYNIYGAEQTRETYLVTREDLSRPQSNGSASPSHVNRAIKGGFEGASNQTSKEDKTSKLSSPTLHQPHPPRSALYPSTRSIKTPAPRKEPRENLVDRKKGERPSTPFEWVLINLLGGRIMQGGGEAIGRSPRRGPTLRRKRGLALFSGNCVWFVQRRFHP